MTANQWTPTAKQQAILARLADGQWHWLGCPMGGNVHALLNHGLIRGRRVPGQKRIEYALAAGPQVKHPGTRPDLGLKAEG